MASQITRYENPVRNTREIDVDSDGVIDGFKSSDRPRYSVDCNRRASIWTWYKAGFKLLWFYPFSFAAIALFGWYVVRPIAFTAPVALLRNNPKVLTEKEAGGELNAATNNIVVGIRSFTGSTLESVQESQIKANEQNSDRRPADSLMPKTRVVFVEE